MRRFVFLSVFSAMALLAGWSASLAGPKEPMEVPTTAEAFEKIVEKLKAEAEAFVKVDDDKGPALSPTLKQVQYSKESAKPLAKALQSGNGKPLVRLHVAYQLLHPLKMAGDETIRPVRSALVKLLESDCQYRPMPRWPQATLATLNPPANLPADRLMQQMEEVQKIRQQKATAERPVVKHNRTVREVEKAVKQVLAAIGDNTADDALLKRLAAEERSKFLTYEDTLAAIKAEAAEMKQERAKSLYKQLKAMAYRVGNKKWYLDPTVPNYSITGNSSFHAKELYFAVSTLHLVNLLATPAKEPAVPVPDVKKFEQEQKERRDRPKPRPGRVLRLR